MEALTPEQLAILAGIVVSLLLSAVKRIWPQYATSPTFVKQTTSLVAAVLAVGFASNWKLDAQALYRILSMWAASLVTYQALSKPNKPKAAEV